MQFVLTEEQSLLRDQVRDLLEKQATPESLRTLITNRQPWNPDLWRAMAELGLLGAAIPESYGGVGLGPMELAVISEELGRAVAPVPFFSSVCMAAEAIALAGSDEQKARWLPAIATGATVATFAWAEGSGGPGAPCSTTWVDGRLSGCKWPVPDAGIASLCVVLAATSGGPALALLELGQSGVTRTPLDGFDELRHHELLTFDGAAAELLTGAPGAETLDALFDRLAVYEAFEQLGGTESALYMARDYTMQRFIFGRQLASYQAVKHNLADILVLAELARGNACYALGTITDALPDRRAAAATARIGATEAYEKAARENLQLHGGIGFTWEANCHFHYRRARLLALNIGSLEIWADRLIESMAARIEAPRAA